MSQLPIDQRPNRAPSSTRQGMWTLMRELTEFSIADVADYGKGPKSDAQKYVNALCAANIVERGSIVKRRIDGRLRDVQLFVLVRDMGHSYPRVRADGSLVGQDRGQLNMWRAMRMIPSFDAQDIALHATTEETTVTLSTAKTYIKHLMSAGYFRVLKKAKAGKNGHLARYKLVRDTGPLAPKIQRVKQVYDQNLDAVTHCPNKHEELA